MRCHSLGFSLVSSIALLLMSGCDAPKKEVDVAWQPENTAAQETQKVNFDQRILAFFQEVSDRELAESPISQASRGIKTDRYGEWDDISEAARARHIEQKHQDLERLHEFDFDALNADNKISYLVFEYNANQEIDAHKWRNHEYAIDNRGGYPAYIPVILQNYHKIDDVSDAQAYLSRLRSIDQPMAAVRAHLAANGTAGVYAPHFVYASAIGIFRNIITGAPFDQGKDSALLADFRKKVNALEIEQAEKDDLIDAAKDALKGPVTESYTALIKDLEKLQKSVTTDHGIWNAPQADQYYVHQIQYHTTTSATADELHELGLAEVARIRAEMEVVKNQAGFSGSLDAYIKHVRTDSTNYYPNTDEGRKAYIADATEMMADMMVLAPNYFGRLPKANLEVRSVEPWRAGQGTAGSYSGGSADGSRPGIYYIDTSNMKTVQKHMMDSLAYHEGAPGHHFQSSIQKELQDVPEFRRFGGYTAYSEGWALYSEYLAKEMGVYEGKPVRDFGRLSEEMKRAVRLVVDTGIHTRKWSLQKARDFMAANTPMTEAQVDRQIKRYFVWPGQALAYKVGMLKILELREKAKRELGSNFDIRKFHDVVLGAGSVPMNVLERTVDDYIQSNT